MWDGCFCQTNKKMNNSRARVPTLNTHHTNKNRNVFNVNLMRYVSYEFVCLIGWTLNPLAEHKPKHWFQYLSYRLKNICFLFEKKYLFFFSISLLIQSWILWCDFFFLKSSVVTQSKKLVSMIELNSWLWNIRNKKQLLIYALCWKILRMFILSC